MPNSNIILPGAQDAKDASKSKSIDSKLKKQEKATFQNVNLVFEEDDVIEEPRFEDGVYALDYHTQIKKLGFHKKKVKYMSHVYILGP